MESHPNHALAMKMQTSVAIIRIALKFYKRLAFSFNGGKDSTVVLHLLRLACYIEAMEGEMDPLSPHQMLQRRAPLFYLHTEAQFPEMARFLIYVARKYRLQILAYAGHGFKSTLFTACTDMRPDAVFLGVRRGDPDYSGVLSHTTAGWPAFTRVAPIASWSYVDVWDFLIRFGFKYCRKYNEGYTSIGGVGSRANPLLRGREHARLSGERLRGEFLSPASVKRAGPPLGPQSVPSELGRKRALSRWEMLANSGPQSPSNVQSPGLNQGPQESPGHLSEERIGASGSSAKIVTVFDVLQSDRGLESSEVLAGSVFASDSEEEYVPLEAPLSTGEDASFGTPVPPPGDRIGGGAVESEGTPASPENGVEMSHAIFLGIDEIDAEREAR